MAFLLRRLPTRLTTAVKERLVTVRPLDYPRHHVLLAIDSQVEYLARLRACQKEPETIEWIERFVRPGDVVFDIGANVGAYSLVIDAFTRGRAKVYAFEPSSVNFAQLTRNIWLNRSQDRVVPLPVALAATTGMVRFNYSSLVAGSALHALGASVDNKGRDFEPVLAQPVLAFRLDDLIKRFGIEPPNHIKLDVDGTELDVLIGACRTLTLPSLRSILIELEPALETSTRVLETLRANGFLVHSFRSHGEVVTDTRNYIFVRPATESPLHS